MIGQRRPSILDLGQKAIGRRAAYVVIVATRSGASPQHRHTQQQKGGRELGGLLALGGRKDHPVRFSPEPQRDQQILFVNGAVREANRQPNVSISDDRCSYATN